MRREKSRTEIFFGYPIKVKRIMSKKSSWEGFIVEPILIYSMDEETGGSSLIDELPVINSSVIKGEKAVLRQVMIMLKKLFNLKKSWV